MLYERVCYWVAFVVRNGRFEDVFDLFFAIFLGVVFVFWVEGEGDEAEVVLGGGEETVGCHLLYLL